MKLADYLAQKRMTRVDFAKRIGVSPQLITGYCNGDFWPSRPRAQRIFKVTGGLVTPNDFLDLSRRAVRAAS